MTDPNTSRMEELSPLVQEQDPRYMPSHRNALGYFVEKRQWQLRGQKALAPYYDVDSSEPNPYDAALERNAEMLRRLFFLEENGLRRLAYKYDESEAAFIERAAKLEEALLQQGLTPSLVPTIEELDALAVSYEPPGPRDANDLARREWPVIDPVQQWNTCMAEMHTNELADKILRGPEPPQEEKANIDAAIAYLETMGGYAEQFREDTASTAMVYKSDLLKRLLKLKEEGIADVDFVLDEDGICDYFPMAMRIKAVEKALASGTPIPPPKNPTPRKPRTFAQDQAMETLCGVFPKLLESSIKTDIADYTMLARELEERFVLVTIKDGSFVAFDVEDKRAYPFVPPQGRPGNAENYAGIVVNNIGWTDDPVTGSFIKPAASFIEKPYKCATDGPTMDMLLAISGDASSRPRGEQTAPRGPSADPQ